MSTGSPGNFSSLQLPTGRLQKKGVPFSKSSGQETYRAVVTSKVLDEGIDVPEANIGIIASGTGSKRAYIQRLGRILRKKEGKEAVLYEIIAEETTETGTARRRKEAVSARKKPVEIETQMNKKEPEERESQMNRKEPADKENQKRTERKEKL